MTTSANVAKILEGPGGYALVILVGAGVLYMVWKGLKGPVTAGAQAIGHGAAVAGSSIWNQDPNAPNNLNAGTPYAGTGPIGTLGNVTNQASGGVLSSIGDWLGGKAADWFGPTYDPNAAIPDNNTPPRQTQSLVAPVSPAPSVLPYSYKQATVDVPSVLGSDAVFTPGYGSSGNYVESGVPGTDTSAYGSYPGF